jgi:hypothetical protein
MNTNEALGTDSAMNNRAAAVDMKLEVVIIPVSDVDRSKEFYAKLGCWLDADFYLVVSDLTAARDAMVSRGVDVGEVFPPGFQVLSFIQRA